MAERSAKGCLVAAFVWIVIIGVLAVAGKYFILPYLKKKEKDDLAGQTGSQPKQYDHTIVVNADSFSGYCLLRSPRMRDDLRGQSIDLRIVDDGADYPARMKALRDGTVQMAVFTVDSFVLTGAQLGEFPATIVLVIDETTGADAMVAYKTAVAKLQDLDHPDARIVLTPQSPSEFLARTVIAHFSLPRLPQRWWIEADGAEDVYKQFKAAKKTDKRAFVLWEPYVSNALELPDAHLLMDSSKLKGYIVDVLVAERKFLRDRPELVRKVVEAYLRATYSYGRDNEGMQTLVREDARRTEAESLKKAQADKLVEGIEWKNTQENYAYFGLLSADESRGLQRLDEIINNIADILVKTGALSDDPVRGKTHTLYYDRTLKEMQVAKFHPGAKLNLIDMGNRTPEQVRGATQLRALNEAQWEALREVVMVKVDPISFARGTARLNIQGKRNLDALARKLPTWPRYYLRVAGNARAEGDPEANLRLAQQRAKAAADYLIAKGISATRIQAKATPPSATNGSAQSVSFVLLEEPY